MEYASSKSQRTLCAILALAMLLCAPVSAQSTAQATAQAVAASPATAAPVVAAVAIPVTAVAGEMWHTLARIGDGAVWSWGDNQHGQLGDGTTARRLSPARISGLSDIRAIAARASHSLELKSDGSVLAWGDNSFGQLGLGFGLGHGLDLDLDLDLGLGFGLGLVLGLYLGLGLAHGPAGAGDSPPRGWAPRQLSSINRIAIIGTGDFHSIAVRGDGLIWSWGRNGTCQVGDSATANRFMPSAIWLVDSGPP